MYFAIIIKGVFVDILLLQVLQQWPACTIKPRPIIVDIDIIRIFCNAWTWSEMRKNNPLYHLELHWT